MRYINKFFFVYTLGIYPVAAMRTFYPETYSVRLKDGGLAKRAGKGLPWITLHLFFFRDDFIAGIQHYLTFLPTPSIIA
jgi:hypothetical protein